MKPIKLSRIINLLNDSEEASALKEELSQAAQQAKKLCVEFSFNTDGDLYIEGQLKMIEEMMVDYDLPLITFDKDGNEMSSLETVNLKLTDDSSGDIADTYKALVAGWTLVPCFGKEHIIERFAASLKEVEERVRNGEFNFSVGGNQHIDVELHSTEIQLECDI